MFEERDIRRAGQALAEFTVARDDVVEVQLPAYSDHHESDLENWGRPDWRSYSAG
ncbi:hypothetical protein [Streptomyces sp. NPDC048489]|uniref:hypothetical protein n=1 Tax=Streptomyces sp. NPDC048489 TaxID=3154504 RepID=UPI00342AB9E8